MPLRLIISDLDGTIVETEDYHRRAYNVLFKEIGLQVSWSKQDYIDRLKVMGGEKLREVFAWLKPPQEEYLNFKKEMYLRKTQLYVQLISADLSSGVLDLRPGIKRLFDEAINEKVPIAIGTACEKKAAYQVLHAALGTDFLDSLKVLCGGDDTPLKKPDPSIYLMVAEKCEVNPKDCVVLEDTRHGMEAAIAAGMKCVVTPSEYAMDHDFENANLKLFNLETPSPTSLKDLSALWK